MNLCRHRTLSAGIPRSPVSGTPTPSASVSELPTEVLKSPDMEMQSPFKEMEDKNEMSLKEEQLAGGTYSNTVFSVSVRFSFRCATGKNPCILWFSQFEVLTFPTPCAVFASHEPCLGFPSPPVRRQHHNRHTCTGLWHNTACSFQIYGNIGPILHYISNVGPILHYISNIGPILHYISNIGPILHYISNIGPILHYISNIGPILHYISNIGPILHYITNIGPM